MKLAKNLFIVPLLLTFFQACEPKEVIPTPDPIIDSNNPVNVLNDNSGYRAVYNLVKDVAGIGGSIPGGLDLEDFTIENNRTLHIAYSSGFQSQQDYLKSYFRENIDLSTLVTIPLPNYAFETYFKPQDYSVTSPFFRPYKNILTYNALIVNTTAGNSSYQSSFRGDVNVTIPRTYNYPGKPDMGYKFPNYNWGPISKGGYAYGYFCTGVPEPDHLFSVSNPYLVNFNNTTGFNYLSSLFETRFSGGFNYYAFMLRNEALEVRKVDPTLNTNSIYTQLDFPSIPANSNFIEERFYTPDGNTLAILYKDTAANKHWTFTFNFTTNTLAKGLMGTTLEYAAAGSDITLDEFGNIYYSGKAGNGSNPNGVSIYKKDVSGSTSLIGSDNFLKYGTITKLKTLYGKTYIGIVGSVTNSSKKQITIIEQN